MLSGGRSWQATDKLRAGCPMQAISGILTRGRYSSPLAVMMLIRRLDFAGSQPIAAATLGGMMVVVAPVSRPSGGFLHLALP